MTKQKHRYRKKRKGEGLVQEWPADVADPEVLARLWREHSPRRVVHLAAQAGVRYSIEAPRVYVHSNLVGFAEILEACRHGGVEHLVCASTSSLYGQSPVQPFREDARIDRPLSLYAATKGANELMAHSYAHLFRMPVTALRFFTVYGPWGRPDMAPLLFTRAILEGRPIRVFNHGQMKRDFTYVDDIVEGVIRTLDRIAEPDPAFDPMQPNPGTGSAPYRVFNIGNHDPVELMEFVAAIEDALGTTAQKNFLPLQDGDVPATYADTAALNAWTGFAPATSVREGVGRFIAWYREYYRV